MKKLITIFSMLLVSTFVSAQTYVEMGDTTIRVNTIATVLYYQEGETQEIQEDQRVTIKYYAASDSLPSWCTVKIDVDKSKLPVTEDGIVIARPMLNMHDVKLFKIMDTNSICYYLYKDKSFVVGVAEITIDDKKKWIFTTSASK